MQIKTLSELFDETVVMVPCLPLRTEEKETPLTGHNLSVIPLTPPIGRGIWRKFGLLLWLVQNGPVLLKETWQGDAIHAPIPGDIGSLGMFLAFILRKPLFVRHCGNWFVQRTIAERFWKWFMERFAGNQNVMFATGGALQPPSSQNPNIRWIFATSLTKKQLEDCATKPDYAGDVWPRLIIACRQEKDKGTSTVIESLPLILKEFPKATLDIVGDGRALDEFKNLAINLGVSEQVTFHGRVNHNQVIQLFQQANLLCYPTTASEGFPKVVHEALACGLPVITTHVSVLPQLIKTGCGVLMEEATPTALAQAVYTCLSDSERYYAMSAQAIETASHYSLETWRDTIGDSLKAAWGPLQTDA